MIKKVYPKIFNYFFIINVFLWDIYSGIYQQKMLFLLLPLIYFLCNINYQNIKNKYSFEYYLNLYEYKKYFKVTIILIIFFLILILHKLFFSIGSGLSHEIKSIAKIFFIILTIFCIYYNFEILQKNFEDIVIHSIFLISILFLIEILINLGSGIFTLNYALANNCYDDFFSKNSVVFMEGSHFGMVIPALIISYLIIILEKKKSLVYYVPIVFLLFSTFSLALSITFAISFIFGLGICFLFYKNYKFKLISLILIIFTFINLFNMPRCTIKLVVISNDLLSKIDNKYLNYIDTNHSKNLIKIYSNAKNFQLNQFKKGENKIEISKVDEIESSLSQAVYLNSFKILVKGIKSNIFGYGLGGYKNVFVKYVNETSKDITRDKDINEIVKILNINDASNNFVKLSVELGILSVLIFLSIICFLFTKKIDFKVKIFVLTIIFTQLFIRGAGYFNGGFMICLGIIFVTLFLKNSNEKKYL